MAFRAAEFTPKLKDHPICTIEKAVTQINICARPTIPRSPRPAGGQPGHRTVALWRGPGSGSARPLLLDNDMTGINHSASFT
jgi:hypothetical protein